MSTSMTVSPRSLAIVDLFIYNTSYPLPVYVVVSVDKKLKPSHFYNKRVDNKGPALKETWQKNYGHTFDPLAAKDEIEFCPPSVQKFFTKSVRCSEDSRMCPKALTIYPYSIVNHTWEESVQEPKKQLRLSNDFVTIADIGMLELAHGIFQPVVGKKFIIKWKNADPDSTHMLHIGLMSHPAMMENCSYAHM